MTKTTNKDKFAVAHNANKLSSIVEGIRRQVAVLGDVDTQNIRARLGYITSVVNEIHIKLTEIEENS